MGKTYNFECPHCYYRTRVSGGPDEGLSCRVQTILCHDCRELFDVFTRIRKRQQPIVTKRTLMNTEIVIPPALLVQQPIREFQEKPAARPQPPASFWETVIIFCPVTRTHRVELWRDPGRCPRCGNFMEKNGYPWKLWD